MTEAIPPYDFDPFLDALSTDWYADDALLGALLDRYAPHADRTRLAAFGSRAAGPLRELAERSARPEDAPRLVRHDAYDRRVDDVVLPGSTLEALRVVHGDEGLGAVRGDPFVHYAMIYLLAQNGEAGVACSLACTDGLVRALEAPGAADALADPDRPHARARDEVRGASADGYAHGAQFVTEIQGGSDVPANRARAVPDGDAYRIHGPKWFCSNVNADWFLVTAQPAGENGQGVGLFLVPAYHEGRRNGYTIDRLKDKLGTRALATAEVTFDGALAWAVGPLDRGLAHLLRYVLTPSRFACVLFAASALRRAERIVSTYAPFREAFGAPIAGYPLVRRALESIAAARARALTVSFELLRLWEAAEEGKYRTPHALDFRILLSLAKPVLTRRATEELHEAMMLLGGNGIEERFSPLPRLFRDSVIMETWEGPHNVLYTQAFRDLVRFDVDPGPFIERVTGDRVPVLADRLAGVMGRDAAAGPVALAELAPSLIEAVAAGRDPRRGDG